MNDQLKQLQDVDKENQASLSRRSFIGKAAVTAPVIAAFVSKPTWATDNMCINSGSLSGNLSNHSCQATSRSAHWWSRNISLWNNGQIPGVTPDTPFIAIYQQAPVGFNKRQRKYHISNHQIGSVDKMHLFDSGTTIGQVLSGMKVKHDGESVVTSSIDKHAVAAYLNLMHPGIAYTGYSDPNRLISSYNTARSQYLATPTNSIFNNLARSLKGVNSNNDERLGS